MSDDAVQIRPEYSTEIQEIDNSNLSLREKYIRLKRLLERSCKDITLDESLQFPSLFSRLVFISQKYDIPKSLEWQLQNTRVKGSFLQRDEKHVVTSHQYHWAKESILRLFSILSGENIQEEIDSEIEVASELPLDKIRVQVTDIDRENETIICKSDYLIDEELRVRYNVTPINEQFNQTIDRLWIGAQLNLIDIKRNENGDYIPKIFVLEPDYLIDASAIAECFQSYGSSYLHYFRRKFEQPVNSHYILLGNLANFFLDELIYAADPEEVLFNDTFLKSFRQMPFEYASCNDIKGNHDFKDFMLRARTQFDNIKRVVLHDMPENNFELSECTLEPSFFCEKYGFQGRLDLLQLSTDDKGLNRILELKSGKPPYPREDVTKIAPNHEAQTVVYRLMIQSVFGKDAREIYAAILYSSAENRGQNIRLAAHYQKLEKEILNIRNLIIATEHDLYTGDSDAVKEMFRQLFNLDNYGRTPDFFVQRLSELEEVIKKASGLEQEYFYRYISFVTRELYLQKMGDEGYDSSMSTSALWNTTFNERQEALDLIANLEIEEIEDSGRDMKIRFRRTSSDCVNFREGEICILYPRQDVEDTLLTNQILKGNLVEISDKHILLRFRYKQRNLKFFSKHTSWVVEHDKLDHSYNSMFRSLSAFLASPNKKKDLLLGLEKPKSTFEPNPSLNETNKEDKQEIVINKALNAEDYFLIVGPPGTGKTSIFARRLIEEFHNEKDTDILVIAYTNRAVDELCAAVCQAFNEKEDVCAKYIRIGTELSCGEAYRHRLLQSLTLDVKSRSELLDTITDKRIIIGTLASIVGKPELFDLKKFGVAIIDEASQILEPQIIGLLPLVDKFILIGDHKQLSTITLQDPIHSKVDNTFLNTIELNDCRESLFERLYRICQQRGWTDCYDTLVYHGRMHQSIADFVNTHFYDKMLQVATERQDRELAFDIYDDSDTFESLIATKRFAFIPNRIQDDNNLSDKTNRKEAEIVVQLVRSIVDLYKKNNLDFDAKRTIGVITPYRNQIALIKQKLSECLPSADDIMVDTVERYQGSQRDIIIVSCCFNKDYQLKYFSNMNREGTVDRKLNVTLTRAREQLFVIGNDIIMRQNPIYKNLLDWFGV